MTSSISATELKEVLEHENAHWSKIFKAEKESSSEKLFSSYWWEDYYNQITKIISTRLEHGSSILELGSGSGKATLLLGDSHTKHLVDISPFAIDYAKYLASKLKAKNVTFSVDNGFKTKLKSKSYDFTWNIGVVEHYNRSHAEEFIGEMIRLTKDKGSICVAVPNFKSFHILKARLLTLPYFKFIPGYRLDSENNYEGEDISDLIRAAAKTSSRKIKDISFYRAGNPMPMGTPSPIFRLFGSIADKLFYKHKFLLIVFVELGVSE